ncbi:unnamed protein product [Ambrosiozyma monospora]|uniref:Unnamed protein product n=1 Tax=Ambrosiozyma monospora TaxID=43982 RepID=A0ACB5SSF4_AMBMO|nr:unnamed protein product [Ambrosiozyma monospora]
MFTSMFPIIHQELISSCPNLEDVVYFCSFPNRRVVETAGEFPVFRIASDTITHYMYECHGFGWQCEISGLTHLKSLVLGGVIRGSVIGRCIPDSVEHLEIESCSLLDLEDFSCAYLFKLPKALKRLKVDDSKVCFKNLMSLKCLEKVMLKFRDRETGAVTLATPGEGQMSNKRLQHWSSLRIVSKIVSELPVSVIFLEIDYPNEFFYNSHLDLRYLEQLAELQIGGASITHYKVFEKLPLELLKLVIYYHPIELTEDEQFESDVDGSKSGQTKFTLDLGFHQFKTAKNFRSSQIVIENNDEEKVDEEDVCDVTVKLSSSLVRCLSNYIIDSNYKCQFCITDT